MTVTGRTRTAAFGLTLMTAACGASDTTDTGPEARPIERQPLPQNEFTPVEVEATIDNLVAEINENSIQPMQLTVLMKSLRGFFAPIATGAKRAMGELGAAGRVTGNVLGPTEYSGDQQKDMELQTLQIEQAVAEGAEGIAISPFGEGNVPSLDEAAASGIPVVTLETDLASSKRSIYVGIDNDSAGATAGRTLLALLPEAPGTVMIHGTDDPTWVDGVARTQAAQRVFEEAGYDVLVHPINFMDEAEDIASMGAELEAADPPVVGLIGLFAVSYRCPAAADAAGAPDLPIVGFDFEPQTVGHMREGRIKATHVQRQYYTGYLGPYIAYGIKNIGLDATRAVLAPQLVGEGRFDLGVDVVPAEKVDAFNDFLDSIGAEQ
ncbi:substrate-binding domain-containing protein [Sorangium sp. So ce136]|uniref:substrate-binding domain-containing protein n=1 Tax=Sorangium sp. So ce136 TaxID=3133284 RepID=UPI003F0CEA11